MFLQYGDALGGTAGYEGIPMLGGFMAAFAGLFLLILIVFIALYVYGALAWMAIAKRTKTEPAWLAWIPIANYYLMSKIAKMHWWPILLLIIFWIPILGQIASLVLTVYAIIWTWKAFVAVGRPGWWSLVGMIIAIVGWIIMMLGILMMPLMIVGGIVMFAGIIVSLVLLGIAAWGKPSK